MTLAELIESNPPVGANDGCLADVPSAANDNEITFERIERAKAGDKLEWSTVWNGECYSGEIVIKNLPGDGSDVITIPLTLKVVDAPAGLVSVSGAVPSRWGVVGHVGPPITEAMQAPWGLPAAPAIRPALSFAHLPPVVALSGAAGSGKSTVSEYLAVRYGYTRTKFAKPMKDMCRAIGMTEAMIEGEEKEVPVDWLGGKTPRYAMQRLGTEFGRDCMGEDFWVDLWRESAVLPTVVDDCRFPNEAAAVRRMGGRVLRLTGRGGIAGGHSSEASDFIADDVIENTGTIAELQARVAEVIEGWR